MVVLKEMIDTVPDKKGTYALILRIKKNTFLTVGKLGKFLFQKGYYLYVGSAQGPGGLKGRVRHHCNPCKNPHWHIDYLKINTELEELWIQRSQINHEHRWATFLQVEQDEQFLVKGFGSSDCKCVTHLFYFPNKPERNRFRDRTGSNVESIKLGY